MPRAGGESDKLGNRYEGLWTVHNLIEVLDGEAVALEPEPYDEAKGIEFIKTLPNGVQEFHSVKRQRPGAGWRLADLARQDPRGRSLLNDLFQKLEANPKRRVVFVSTTVESQAMEVWDRAQRCQTLDEFEQQLKTNKGLHEDFVKHVLPLCNNDLQIALDRFHSFRLVSLAETELRRQAAMSVRRLLYRTDGTPVDAEPVVLKLAEFILDSLGRRIVQSDVRTELARHGYHLRDWLRDSPTIAQIDKLNTRYLEHIEGDFSAVAKSRDRNLRRS